ncbi:hypothetical protein AAC387_Pa02g2196 [Persea americana]
MFGNNLGILYSSLERTGGSLKQIAFWEGSLERIQVHSSELVRVRKGRVNWESGSSGQVSGRGSLKRIGVHSSELASGRGWLKRTGSWFELTMFCEGSLKQM